MQCPVCERSQMLRLEEMSTGPRMRVCPGCGGRWVRSDDYWRWRSRLPFDEPAPSPGGTLDADVDSDENLGVKFCPEDGYVLARFKVNQDQPFSIDQCRTCGGVWLDPGEWEVLEKAGLAASLHLILSERWQEDLKVQRRGVTEAEQWLRQLGEEDLARIREIKEWLDGHDKRSQLYAFLRLHERAV